jgi:hypothetical protein
LEHPAATSLLPLARISKFFVVNYMPNTPVGSLDVQINKSIKQKGNSAFPRKPSHPLRPSGKDARARDSLSLREDMALLSRLRPSGLLVKRTSQPEFTQAKEKQNSATSEIRNTTYIYKCLNISKEYLFTYMATQPRF